jgi:hypothetical protein
LGSRGKRYFFIGATVIHGVRKMYALVENYHLCRHHRPDSGLEMEQGKTSNSRSRNMRKQISKSILSAIMICAIVLNGCAVERALAPQIAPQTATELNFAAQLDQAQRDYRTFFKDVGDAQRAGTLTTVQVNILNNVGHQLQTAINSANGLFKTYLQNKDAGLASQIAAFLLTATNLFAQLLTQRTTFLNANAGK